MPRRAMKKMQDGKISFPEFIENKKTGHWLGTTIKLDGRAVPNPEAITLLRPGSKFRRFLEAWAASAATPEPTENPNGADTEES